MKLQQFQARLQTINIGDYVKLLIRGNYADYTREGKLVKVQNGYVYLDSGMAHSYKRIKSIGIAFNRGTTT